MSDMEYIEAEAKRSLSGMTLDVAHWPFMQSQFRFISYNKVGPWCNSTAEALQAYKKEKTKTFFSLLTSTAPAIKISTTDKQTRKDRKP